MKKIEVPQYNCGVTNTSNQVSNLISVGHVGYELSPKDKRLVTSDYPSFRLHYVISGRVKLYVNGEEVILSCPAVFCLIPNSTVSYMSDKTCKTRLYWITFNGSLAMENLKLVGITKEKPYLTLPDKKIERFYAEAINYKNLPPPLMDCFLSKQLFSIFQYLYDDTLLLSDDKSNYVPHSDSDDLSQQAIKIINENMCDYRFNATQCAQALHMPLCSFSRFFHKKFGITFNNYLGIKRIELSVSYLRDTNISIKEISYKCGFFDPLYFSRVFKKYMHGSPNVLRNQFKTQKSIENKNHNL